MPTTKKSNDGSPTGKKNVVSKKVSAARKAKNPVKRGLKQSNSSRSQEVRVVGIGASAGGLEPLELFFDEMPNNSGMAFIVIQHLSPDFRSMMDELLARHTKMEILPVKNGTKIQKNTIYLNPPRMKVGIEGDELKIMPIDDPMQLNLPINYFFESLALERGSRSIGIILSGTGSDGTKGGVLISEAGGIVVVQDPETTKFDAMPRAAIAQKIVSVVAAPGDIPAIIIRHQKGPPIEGVMSAENIIIEDPIRYICHLLREKYGPDFGYYKAPTLKRRIQRRATLKHLESVDDYANILVSDKQELEALYCDLLIGVTSFFRDPKAFDILNRIIFEIAGKMNGTNQIRVWIPGCASGEEAYSIAILFAEFARENNLPLNLKILATDIHHGSLEIARAGIYPAEQLAGVEKKILERYFTFRNGVYTVGSNLRHHVVFSLHNLLTDPPFTQIDLVSCRNLLIYLRNIAQRKVLAMFHFALKSEGIMFLGPSENLGDLESKFTTIDQKWRFFRKKGNERIPESTRYLPEISFDPVAQGSDSLHESRGTNLSRFNEPAKSALAVENTKQEALEQAYDHLLEKFAPTCLLINKNEELLHVFGDAGKYLNVQQGVFSQSITDIVSKKFKDVLKPGIEQVFNTGRRSIASHSGITNAEGVTTSGIIQIDPLPEHTIHPQYALVSFIEKSINEGIVAETHNGSSPTTVENAALQQRIISVERELQRSEDSLQSTIEELETSNEELQSTNEELMASNEELQSTNEELHSVNEELYSVSSEHQRKIVELTELNSDMDNLFSSTDVGTIFLNVDLTIRRFTPSIAKTFNLLERDIGRPIEHVTYRFEHRDLVNDIKSVKENSTPAEREISVDGKFYLLRIHPYLADVGKMTGVVISAFDISELKGAQNLLVKEQRRYRDVVDEQTELVCRFSSNGILTFVNPAYCRFYDKTPEMLLGKPNALRLNSKDRRDFEGLVSALNQGETATFENEITDVSHNALWLQWRIIPTPNDNLQSADYQAVGRDITASKKQSLALKNLHDITVNASLKTDEKITQLLELGSFYFDAPVTEFGVVSKDRFTVSHVYPPIKVNAGQGTRTVGLAENSSYVLMKDGLKLWASENVQVGDKPYGLIRFFKSETDQNSIFSGEDREFLRLIAQWIGLQLFSDRNIEELTAEVRRRNKFEKLLEQKVDALAQSNAELEQFAYIASHDMQEPLRKIETAGLLLLQDYRESLDVDAQELLEIAADGAHRMRSFIEDLLDFARVGTADFVTEKTDLELPLNEAMQDLQSKIEDSDAKIEYGELPSLSISSPYIRQLFQNLIDNSIKYRSKKPLKIRIDARLAGEEWEISITDNGIGVDAEYEDRIFELFQRLHGRSEYSGTGIGLAICRRIVERHGGKIWLDTKYLKGTRFRFTLPVHGTPVIDDENLIADNSESP